MALSIGEGLGGGWGDPGGGLGAPQGGRWGLSKALELGQEAVTALGWVWEGPVKLQDWRT